MQLSVTYMLKSWRFLFLNEKRVVNVCYFPSIFIDNSR